MIGIARLAAAGLLAIMAMGTARAEDALKAKIGVLRLSSSAPVFIAQDKGYFKAEGLDVKIDQGEGSAATITRIMSGAYDAGFGDMNAIIQNAATKPARTVVRQEEYEETDRLDYS